MMLYRFIAGVTGLFVLSSFITTSCRPQEEPEGGLAQLTRDASGRVEITQNPQTLKPSFIRARVPLTTLGLDAGDRTVAVAHAFLERYVDVVGVEDAEGELQPVRTDVDDLGMFHMTLKQVYRGVDVFASAVSLHLGRDGETLVAFASSFTPGISLPAPEPQLTVEDATLEAQKALPNGVPLAARLVVYPGRAAGDAKLAWLVELGDSSIPARNLYFIDAMSGEIVDVLDRLFTARDRQTHDAGGGTTLPGTLARDETSGPSGDADIDNAHDLAGNVYDYFSQTHGRDSFDGQGARLVSTANYGTNYSNAAWNGVQVFYGDDFATKDIAAHEWTHAVTDETADLIYRWQSGALNESFSDMFGAMVDRDDWTIGEDLPGGAFRDLSDPPLFGQPAHTSDWLATCSDNQGVHTNSGITNKAFYKIATDIGKDKAERIFFRTLTINLLGSPQATLEDARAAALQSAEDLYGNGSSEYNAVLNGFNAVGLDGAWQPPENDCSCPITLALADARVYADASESRRVATTLYGMRDSVLSSTTAGRRYRRLYELHMARMTELLSADPALLSSAAEILKRMEPGFRQLTQRLGQEEVISDEMIAEARSFLSKLAEADRSDGEARLAQALEEEIERIDWNQLRGKTFADALDYIKNLARNESAQ